MDMTIRPARRLTRKEKRDLKRPEKVRAAHVDPAFLEQLLDIATAQDLKHAHPPEPDLGFVTHASYFERKARGFIPEPVLRSSKLARPSWPRKATQAFAKTLDWDLINRREYENPPDPFLHSVAPTPPPKPQPKPQSKVDLSGFEAILAAADAARKELERVNAQQGEINYYRRLMCA